MTLTVINPATERAIAELHQAGVEDTDAAVARARAAFPAWREVAPSDRARLLRRLATLLEEQHEALSQLESANAGKPISGARGEIGMVAQVFHFYAGAVDKHYGDTIPVAGGIDVTFREPLGVVGLITPWNFPLNIASWKVGPALATGNTIVIKPAELTPLDDDPARRARPRSGDSRGRAECRRRQGLGRRSASRRAPGCGEDRLHRLDGGRPARDAGRGHDDQARDARARRQVGERRVRGCRPREGRGRGAVLGVRQRRPGLLRTVPDPRRETVYDRFLELLVEATRGVKVGDPADEATEMGPLISAAHRDTVASFVNGGSAVPGDTPEGPGFWFPCTLVEASNDDRVAREEVFGPVAAVIPFADEAEAIRIANDTPYGLSGSIWTRDSARAIRVARGVSAGVLSVNSNSSVRVHTPFGGMKQSGFGRELGMAALDGYTDLKNVFISTEG